MYIRSTLIAFAAVVLTSTVTSTVASAQPHTDSFTYQGQFLDNGEPANGFFDMAFNVLDSEIGGAIVPGGATTVTNVEVVDGLFEAFVDYAVLGSVFDSNQTRWLQINVREVGGPFFTALSPRQRMAPAPLANYSLRSGSSLNDAYNNGGTIFRGVGDPAVDIRSSGASPARLNLGSQTGTEEEGRFYMYTDAGGPMFLIEQDIDSGGGAYFQAARTGAGTPGFIVDGNYFNRDSTRVSIIGESSNIVFSTDVSGDASVQFSSDAINSTEILNEVGVAELNQNGSVVLTDITTVTDVIGSVTIDCPTDGYVFVIATTELSISHALGTSSTVNLGVSASMTSIPSNGDIETRIGSNTPTDLIDHTVTVHSVFGATAGSNTFYFLGDKNFVGGTVQALDTQLSAIFIPTAYGTAALNAGANLPDELTPAINPKSNYDLLLERNAALEANDARIQREMEEMKLQMQQLLEQSKQAQQLQSQD